MLSGDLSRSAFAALCFTLVFKVAVPFLGNFIWMVIFGHPISFLSGFVDVFQLLLFYCICFLVMLIPMVLPRGRLNPAGKAVLITGCDSGFGLLLAKHLHQLGMTVFAGCLLKDKNGQGAMELQKIKSDNFYVLQLDVTSDESVEKAVQFIKLHSEGLWGVVNNAGASAYGEVEWSSIDLYKFVSEVNIFGVIRCTKACLPMIRNSRGRVVNMTSGLARMMAPSRSVYGITKYAMQGFSDCLRYEMKNFGVKVSMIEPGNYISGTNIFTEKSVSKLSDEMWSKMTEEVQQDYGRKWFDYRVNEMFSYCDKGMSDLMPVISAYEDALLSKFPLIRYQPMEG